MRKALGLSLALLMLWYLMLFALAESPASQGDTPAPQESTASKENDSPTYARALPLDFNPGLPPLVEGYLSDTHYRDPSIEVTIQTRHAFDTEIWVARIKVAHPSQLRTLSAGGFTSQRTVSGMAMFKRSRGVIAINGDYFSYIPDGYLIRQGERFRDLPGGIRDVLLIDDKGDFHIVPQANAQTIAPFKDMNIVNSFNFGPALVIGGERVTQYIEYYNAAFLGRQRMGIGQVKKGSLEYIVIGTGGPSGGQPGMTLDQFSRVMADYGVETAYNLDGGNSTMMIFNDKYVNASFERTMRPFSDIIYFASAYAEGQN